MLFTFTKTSSTCHFHFENAHSFWTRFRLISAANIGPNLFHQYRTVSWLTSMPRSCSRSSTFRSESGNRIYSITARRMISGLVLKFLKEAGLVMCKNYATALPRSSKVLLTRPARGVTSLPRRVFVSCDLHPFDTNRNRSHAKNPEGRAQLKNAHNHLGLRLAQPKSSRRFAVSLRAL